MPPLPRPGPNQLLLPSDFQVLFLDPPHKSESTAGPQTGPLGPAGGPALDPNAVWWQGGQSVTVADVAGGSPWRVRAVQLPDGHIAVAALSLGNVDATIQRLLIIEGVAGGAVLVLIGVVAMVVVRLGLRPLTRIEHTAQAIAGGDLDRRVPDSDPGTETGRLGAALNIMLGRLATAIRARERSEQRLRLFVADASHELRTPLTSIRGFAELYRRGGAAERTDVERMMGRIEAEATRMGLLVEDLLLLARLDHGRALDITNVDLVVLAGDAVHDAVAREPDRSVTLLPGNGPVHVLGDEHRLRQVVANLVTNALTHTPPGTPGHLTVGCRAPATGDDAPVAVAGRDQLPDATLGVLEVHDNGPGIPTGQAAHVFDRFYCSTRANSGRRDGSTGLGLAITAAILAAHNGRIELRSAPSRGTTFRVFLPLA
jgi:two-component system OmpR family sensor kinase